MHLVPTDQASRRIIDSEKVCAAFDALDHAQAVGEWTRRFSLLGDPTRLRLLIAIRAAELISVTDLAVATGLSDDHVSQTLRYLRANQTVTSERDGKVVRYQVTDETISRLLDTATGSQ